jgi:hypothetical protein
MTSAWSSTVPWRLLLGLWCFSATISFAQKQGDSSSKPLDPVQGEREGRTLVAELLEQKPEQTYTNGLLKIRNAEGAEHTRTVRFETQITPTNWSSIYETVPGRAAGPSVKLVIVHAGKAPNRYFLSESLNSGASNTPPGTLSPDETMRPFADSDFWIADLGLEFLHWPKQVIAKKEMYSSRFCAVLDSTNPHPTPGSYARVRSWITTEAPHAPVRAEAYDARGKKLKVFDVKSVEKVKGHYQVDAVEMRNVQADTRTIMEFDLGNQ